MALGLSVGAPVGLDGFKVGFKVGLRGFLIGLSVSFDIVGAGVGGVGFFIGAFVGHSSTNCKKFPIWEAPVPTLFAEQIPSSPSPL
jgi:hypothetical protein